MKRVHLIIVLVIILLILPISCVNAGFFDFLANEPTDDSNEKFIDGGTSDNSSSDWLILQNVSKVITNNGTTVSCSIDQGVYANKPSTNLSWWDTYEWSSPFTIEFDILEWEGNPSLRIIDNKTDATKNFSQLDISNGSHVKIISTKDSTEYIVDNEVKFSFGNSFTDAQVGFRLINATITYKNFKIY